MASRFSFKGGISPLRSIHHGKRFTEGRAVERCSVPDEVVIPLVQHIGAPSSPVVAVGDIVDMGQMIAEARGYVSSPCFSSVSGKVKAIELRPHISGQPSMAIVIENDHEDRLYPGIQSPGRLEDLNPDQIIKTIQNAGLVGMGGAAFPTHVKLSPPAEKKIDTVIINGAECEPYLTADHRVMLEHSGEVVRGLNAVLKALGAKNAWIAIENNKPDAIAIIQDAIAGSDIRVAPLRVKYPQGAEKQLIYAVTGRQVPSGGLPMDVGAVVVNAGTAYQICQAIEKGLPLYERVVTVTGSVAMPSNLLVRIGTPISYVISHVGGFSGKIEKVIAGGPMMGIALHNLDAPVMKGTSGILALDEKSARPVQESACIHCGKCVAACPMGLQPYLISGYSDINRFEDAEKYHALDCMECGCCAYNCPANRHLVQSIRLAKTQILNARRKS